MAGLDDYGSSLSAISLLQAETFGGLESHIQSTAGGTVLGDELTAVDTSRTYRLSATARSGDDQGGQYNPDNRNYFGLVLYDVDQNQIDPWQILKHAGATDTTLAANLNPGDTTIVLADATGWNNAGGGYERSFAWYGYTDSTGHTYDDWTYTRNVVYNYFNGAWAAGGINGNTITLNPVLFPNGWNGTTVTAGTAVRNSMASADALYTGMSNGVVPNTWTSVSGSIGGVGTGGSYDPTKFWAGTAYAQVLIYPNYSYGSGNLIEWKDVEFTYAAPEPFHAGDNVELHVNTLDVPGLTYNWTQTSGPTVTLTNGNQPTASFTALTTLVDYNLSFKITVSDGETTLSDTVIVNTVTDQDYASQLNSARPLLNAETFGGLESHTQSTAGGTVLGDDLTAVDTSKTYRLSATARSGDDQGGQYNPDNRNYFGLVLYDVDQNRIDPWQILKHAGATDTTLAANLNPGDTTIVLADATGWNNAGVGYERSFVWYGYTGSTGHTYDDWTYTRNVVYNYFNGAWAAGGINGNTITLNPVLFPNGWDGATVTAGTAVRNSMASADALWWAIGMGMALTIWACGSSVPVRSYWMPMATAPIVRATSALLSRRRARNRSRAIGTATVLAETNQLGKSRGYEYDAVGNLTKLTDRNGRITEYVYDDRYRLDQEIWKTGAGGTARTLDFTYNEASQLVYTQDGLSSYQFWYSRSILGTHRGSLRPAVTFFNYGSVSTNLSASYDGVGNRTSLTAATSRTITSRHSTIPVVNC